CGQPRPPRLRRQGHRARTRPTDRGGRQTPGDKGIRKQHWWGASAPGSRVTDREETHRGLTVDGIAVCHGEGTGRRTVRERWRDYWDPGRVALAVTIGPGLLVPLGLVVWIVWRAVVYATG